MGDFYEEAANQRANEISVERAQALADLERARANSDFQSAAFAVQSIANLDRDWQALVDLHGRYVHSQQPQQHHVQQRSGVDLTPEEAMKVCGLDPNKPEDVQSYVRGQNRLASLKANGHYRD